MTRTPLCENCRFWDTSTQLDAAQPDTTGACRHHAPKVDRRTGIALWPFTEISDWCGEHEFEAETEAERDDGCPKSDPDCLGDNGDCHDACEPPAPRLPLRPVAGQMGARE